MHFTPLIEHFTDKVINNGMALTEFWTNKNTKDMKTYFLMLAFILISLLSTAQDKTELSAYPDNEGNWIVIVQKENGQNADLKLFDRDGQVLAVRSLPQNESLVKVKFVTDQHPDSIFKAVVTVKGDHIAQKQLNKGALIPAQNWTATLDN